MEMQEAKKQKFYIYVKGDKLDPIDGFMLSNNLFTYKTEGGAWSITDVASGLKLAVAKTRAAAEEFAENRPQYIIDVLERAKNNQDYINLCKRVAELNK